MAKDKRHPNEKKAKAPAPAPIKKVGRPFTKKTAAEKAATAAARKERLANMSKKERLIDRIRGALVRVDGVVKRMKNIPDERVGPVGSSAQLSMMKLLDIAGNLPADWAPAGGKRGQPSRVERGALMVFRPVGAARWHKIFGDQPLPVLDVHADGEIVVLKSLAGVAMGVPRPQLQHAQGTPEAESEDQGDEDQDDEGDSDDEGQDEAVA